MIILPVQAAGAPLGLEAACRPEREAVHLLVPVAAFQLAPVGGYPLGLEVAYRLAPEAACLEVQAAVSLRALAEDCRLGLEAAFRQVLEVVDGLVAPRTT